jgi:hypothetical protein
MRISDPNNARKHSERIIAFDVKVNEERTVHVQITCEAVLRKTSDAIANGDPERDMRTAIDLVKANANRRYTNPLYDKIGGGGPDDPGDAELPIFLNELDFRP